jgi:polyhydroxyalkanoate depolymerase
MLYSLFQANSDLTDLARDALRTIRESFEPGLSLVGAQPLARRLVAAQELLDHLRVRHSRPPFGIESVVVDGVETQVIEEQAFATPFATLIRFRKDAVAAQPRVLVVAPLSGHFATLLRSTVRTLLADHEVYVTDWHNARDIPVSAGAFGFDDHVDHVVQFLERIGPGAHVVAVCQPCVQVLAAAAVMAEDGNPATPKSVTLMAGPVDTRISPTAVNRLAMEKPIAWFEDNLLSRVPYRFKGAGRLVYPGFMQLAAFLAMNPKRHAKAHADFYESVAAGDAAKAAPIRDFYEEYNSVLDLTAEFYIETVSRVFHDHEIARGLLRWRGRLVDPSALAKTMLLTVEGERDDICGLGQTAAAHDLATSLPPSLRRHHVQPRVGHYGVFSGRRWENEIYPVVREAIHAAEGRGAAA